MGTQALKPHGRFVFSTHHHGLVSRLRGEEKSGRYKHVSIYRENFTPYECEAETRPYFGSVRATPIQVYIPFATRLRLPIVARSRFFERIRLLDSLCMLNLCTAERPLRAGEGETSE
jgi:hypothetical protein